MRYDLRPLLIPIWLRHMKTNKPSPHVGRHPQRPNTMSAGYNQNKHVFVPPVRTTRLFSHIQPVTPVTVNHSWRVRW